MSQIVVWVVLICAPMSGWAGQWSQPCKSSAEASKAACVGEAAKAKAADAGRTSQNMARYGSANEITNPGAAMNQHGTANAQNFPAAKSLCEQKQKECEQKCKTQESQRKSAEANPKTRALAQADKTPMQEGEKTCASILPLIAELGTGASEAAKAAGEAGKTNSASNGMPLPLPIPLPGKDDKKEEGAKGENPMAEKLNCENEGYSKYSDCNDHFIGKCEKGMTAAGCDGFIARYCGGTQTPTPAPAPVPVPGNDSLKLSVQTANSAAVTANLVADKQGEGLGSKFCQKVTAYKYCQMAGRSECPSCKNLNSPWPAQSNPGQLADAQKSCPTDPMFLDPAVQAQMKKPSDAPASDASQVSTSLINDRFSSSAPSAGAAGGGGGGGSLGGAGGAGSVGAEPAQGVAGTYQSQSASDSFAAGGGAGGGGDGGGSSYEGSASGPGYAPASVNGNARREPTMVGQAGPKDVANQYGPSVFSIQSTTYRDMCARGRLLHCRR